MTLAISMRLPARLWWRGMVAHDAVVARSLAFILPPVERWQTCSRMVVMLRGRGAFVNWAKGNVGWVFPPDGPEDGPDIIRRSGVAIGQAPPRCSNSTGAHGP